MTLDNVGSALARRQRHNAFLFSRFSSDPTYRMMDGFLFISLECKPTGTFPSQVRHCCAGAGVPVWTVLSRRTSSREVRTLRHASCVYFTRPGYTCFAKLTTCVLSRGVLKRTVYCAFMLMVRLSFPSRNKLCTKYITDVLQW